MSFAAPAAQAVPVDAPGSRSPFGRRLVDLFFTPGRLFAELRHDSRAWAWAAPILAAVAVVALVETLRWVLVTDRQLAEAALAQMSSMGEGAARPTLDQLEQGAVFTRVAITVGALLSATLWPAILGAVLWVVFVVMGGRAGYRGHFAVAAWASLVSILGYAFVSALQFASGRLDLRLDLALLAPDASPPLAGVLHSLSPFSVWLVLLLALGGAAVNGRRGWAAPAAVLLALTMSAGLVGGLIAAAAAG